MSTDKLPVRMTSPEREQLQAHEYQPTSALLSEALNDARELATTELELAKREMRKDLHDGIAAASATGAAGFLATIGVTMCAVGLCMAVTSWVLAVCIGGGCLVLAAVVGLLAYARVPKQPLPMTTHDIVKDVRGADERLA